MSKPILVIYKKSAYDRYKNTKAKTFLQSNHLVATQIKQNHLEEKNVLKRVTHILNEKGVKYELVQREKCQHISNRSLVITVGGDGTFLDVSHLIKDSTPVLGINSNPSQSVGFYCVTTVDDFEQYLTKKPITKLPRLKITLNNMVLPHLVLNDLLIAHENPAATTRYRINKDTKICKTSGLLIAAPGGSTGWIFQEGGKVQPITTSQFQYLSRGMRGETSHLAKTLTVHSFTPEAKLYIDGTNIKYDFPMGNKLKIKFGKPLMVVGDLRLKQRPYTKI